MYRTSDLLNSIQVRGLLPLANADLTGSNLLMFASEEMQNDLVPSILTAREDFYCQYKDFGMPGEGQELPIPERAIGDKIRNVQFVNSNGGATEVVRRQIEELPTVNLGYYVMNNGLQLVNRFGSSYNTVRVYYYLTPGQLVDVSETANITAVSGTALTLDIVPSTFTSGALYDVVSSRPNFGTLLWDATGTLVGNVMYLSNGTQQPGAPSTSLPSTIKVGDVVSLAGQTSVIQMPVAFHSVLAQAVIVKCLEAVGDREGMAAAQVKLQRAQKNALILIGNRTENSPIHIVPTYAPSRNWY